MPKIDFPLDGLIDRVFDQIDASKRKRAQDLTQRIADSLAALKYTHDDGTVESALLETTRLLSHFGISDQAFAKLGLDGEKAADCVLAHVSFTRDEHLEIEPLCRKLLTSFYQSVRNDPDLLAELLPHLHAETVQGINTIQAQVKELRELVGNNRTAEIQRENHLTQAALDSMFSILQERNVPPERLDAKLRQIAERHVELTGRLHSLSNSNNEPKITERREHAAEALGAGHYDQAERLLEEAETLGWQAIAEQEEALDRQKLDIAESRFQRGALERTRLNYRNAARHFAEAANLVPASEGLKRLYYLVQQASTLYEQGDAFGDNFALAEAIGIYEKVLNERPSSHAPLGWSMIQNSLGLALQTLGDREPGTGRLNEAVNIFQQILQESTQRDRPMLWAGTQVNLGLALAALGERESGTERIEQAVNAYHQALEVYKRERVPHEWATTQNNLGNALAILGERENSRERLEEAVCAYHQALKGWTRERVPLDWALTQSNLGNALKALAKQEENSERVWGAICSYRLALEEATRERAPLQWARTQNSLGLALVDLGEREGGAEILIQAVAAFRAALEEWMRERVPLQWAGAQFNLGNALMSLGERDGSTERMKQAVNAFRAALKERRRDHLPLQWAWTQENIGLACWSIAERTRDEVPLLQGIKAIQVAIEAFRQEQATFDIKKASRNLIGAKALLADLRGKGPAT